MKRSLLVFIILAGFLFLIGCAEKAPVAPKSSTGKIAKPAVDVAVTLMPYATSQVRLGGKFKFDVLVTGTDNKNVIWRINGIDGGNLAFGIISKRGFFKAPSVMPTPDTFPIEAISVADTSKRMTRTIKIVPISDMVILVKSAATTMVAGWVGKSRTELALLAVVSGTAKDKRIRWLVNEREGGTPLAGMVKKDAKNPYVALYTAPKVQYLKDSTYVRIKAVSVVNPGIYDFIEILVVPNRGKKIDLRGPNGTRGPLALNVNKGAIINAGIDGTDEKALEWAILWGDKVLPEGDDTVGTLSPDPKVTTIARYTAPAAVPNPDSIFIRARLRSTLGLGAPVTGKFQIKIAP